MAAHIESMMYRNAGGTPWHTLGNPVDDAIAGDTRAAFAAAGVNKLVTHETLVGAVSGLHSDHKLVVRDGKVVGTVGPNTEILQDSDVADYFAPFVEAGALIETAGALEGGRKVWALARLRPGNDGDEIIADDDRVKRYLLLGHAHDNTMSVNVGMTGIRVVCANTLQLATGRGSGLAKIRHTKSMLSKITDAMARIAAAHQVANATMQRFRDMTKIPVRKRSQIAAYLASVFGPAEAERQAKARKENERTDLEISIETLMRQGRGSDMPHARGTAWGLYNAVTEYLTHCAGRSKNERTKAERRLDSNAWGEGARIMTRAASDDVLKALADHASGKGERVVSVPAGGGIPIEAVLG